MKTSTVRQTRTRKIIPTQPMKVENPTQRSTQRITRTRRTTTSTPTRTQRTTTTTSTPTRSQRTTTVTPEKNIPSITTVPSEKVQTEPSGLSWITKLFPDFSYDEDVPYDDDDTMFFTTPFHRVRTTPTPTESDKNIQTNQEENQKNWFPNVLPDYSDNVEDTIDDTTVEKDDEENEEDEKDEQESEEDEEDISTSKPMGNILTSTALARRPSNVIM